ncbi:hypothetical protein GF314_12500 [bacterium]|nr:hypothetical protein [bacterium]
MMRIASLLMSLVLLVACSDDDSSPADPGTPPDQPTIDDLRLGTYAGFAADLARMASVTDSDPLIDAVWDTLRAHDRFPFVHQDSVMFLYRGTASSVAVAGDFNGWNPASGSATRLGDGDVWIAEYVFPTDARLDYKFVRDGGTWLLDPENPLRQRSGFGDNSELRMPGYVPSPWVEEQDGVVGGTLVPGSLASTALGYDVDYVVYQPAGHQSLTELPVMYVTDGHEYADPLMGSMVQVLDNLIAAGEITPIMAVFIDPRIDGTNRRAEQYILNPDFASFVADELVPLIDATYATSTDRADRGILGTSLGGLNSAYFGVQETDTFKLIVCQSPAFQAGSGGILPLYAAAPLLDLDIFLTWGAFYDFGETTVQMQTLLDTEGYDYQHIVVNEGHSWGNWRALLDDILIHYFGTD